MPCTGKHHSYFLFVSRLQNFFISNGATLADLHAQILKQYPKLAGTENCTLKAVGVDYQDDDFVLSEGDEVSLFPPVQGG